MKPAAMMKRVLAFVLCIALLTADVMVTNATGVQNTEVPAEAVNEIENTKESQTESQNDTFVPSTEEDGAEKDDAESDEKVEETESTEQRDNTESTENDGQTEASGQVETEEQERKTVFDYADEAVHVVVTLSDEKDLPAGAELVVTPVEVTSEMEASIDKAMEGEKKEKAGMVAYDISFIKDGEEVEPGATVQVQLSLAEVNEGDAASVYHFDETNNEMVDMNANTSANGEVTFGTDHFSKYVIVNNGDNTVQVTIEHYDNSKYNPKNEDLARIYSSDVLSMTPESRVNDYKKIANWDIDHIMMNRKSYSEEQAQNVSVTEDTVIKVFYNAQAITEYGKNVTFYDYLVKPADKNESINCDANYPEGSRKSNRFAIGSFSQNYESYKYYTKINEKQINGYTSGTGDAAYKTGIVTGLSDDYSTVLFSVDEPGVFSEENKNGKTVLQGYQLQFARTGDTYQLTTVLNSEGEVVADDMTKFFPLDHAASNVKDNGYGSAHNYFFGMRYDVDFTIGSYVGELNYSFTGDDDVWVILDGKYVVVDLGGIHDALSAEINLWDWLNNTQYYTEEQKKGEHRLTVLYMERGANLSNCQMNFTLPNAKIIDVANTTASLNFTKVNTKNEPLEGAAFQLVDTVTGNKYNAESQGNGQVKFSHLAVGTYTLTETMAPSGYTAEDKVWIVKVRPDGNQNVTASLYEADGTTPVADNQITNRTTAEFLDKNLEYSKTAKLTDWDNREYQIDLSASSKLISEYSTITQSKSISGVQVTDTIAKEFMLAAGEKERLMKDGASVTEKEDGTTVIIWTDQEVKPKENETAGWHKSVKVVAKPEYIGGNNVATNVNPGSFISYGSTQIDLPKPTVNVKIQYSLKDASDKIFLGESLAQYADGAALAIKNDNQLDNLILSFYTDEPCSKEITMEQLKKETPQSETIYYVKSVYEVPPATDASNANSTINGIVYKNENVAATPKDGKEYAAQYDVSVKTGTLTIEKRISKSDIKAYEGDPIFTFKITNQTTDEVYYKTLRFGENSTADQTISNGLFNVKAQTTLEGLPQGIYKVEELDTMGFHFEGFTVNKNSNCASRISGNSAEFAIGIRTDREECSWNAKEFETKKDDEHLNADRAFVTAENVKARNDGKLTDTDAVKNSFVLENNTKGSTTNVDNDVTTDVRK